MLIEPKSEVQQEEEKKIEEFRNNPDVKRIKKAVIRAIFSLDNGVVIDGLFPVKIEKFREMVDLRPPEKGQGDAE